MGTGRRIPTRLPRQRRTLRRVLPRHHDQPIGNLLVGGKQGKAQTDVGLAVKIGRARHDEDPRLVLQRGRFGAVPDKFSNLLTDRVCPAAPAGAVPKYRLEQAYPGPEIGAE